MRSLAEHVSCWSSATFMGESRNLKERTSVLVGWYDLGIRNADLPRCQGKARTASCCRTRRHWLGRGSMKGRGSTGLLRCCCFPLRHQSYPAHDVAGCQDTVINASSSDQQESPAGCRSVTTGLPRSPDVHALCEYYTLGWMPVIYSMSKMRSLGSLARTAQWAAPRHV